MGRGFAIWMGVTMLGVVVFVIGALQIGEVEGCRWDPAVETYDNLGVPVTGACVGGSTSSDWIPWAAAGGALMTAGLVGSVWSGLTFGRRARAGAFDGIGGPTAPPPPPWR